MVENIRSPAELQAAAEALLKGCKEHFKTGIRRLCHINGIIPEDQKDDFKKLAEQLCQAETVEEFEDIASTILKLFLLVENWLAWWMRPANAQMLFPSARVMAEALWRELPASTNAEESIHWLFYCCVGKNQELMDGLLGLHLICKVFEKAYNDAISKCSVSSTIGMTSNLLRVE